MDFETKRLPVNRDHIAPDHSDVRLLLMLETVQMAHYELPPGQISLAITNRTVEEIWFILSGRGEMWRRQDKREEIVPLEHGVCVTIPKGTHFQFRSLGYEALEVLGITTPRWPGAQEAILVDGNWEPTTNDLHLRTLHREGQKKATDLIKLSETRDVRRNIRLSSGRMGKA